MFSQDVDNGGQLPLGRRVVAFPLRRLASTGSNEPPLSILYLLQHASKRQCTEVRPNLKALPFIVRVGSDWFLAEQLLQVLELALQVLVPLQLLLLLLGVHLMCERGELGYKAAVITDNPQKT